MSVSLLCPTCGRAVTAELPTLAGCPHCGAVLPPALLAAVQEQLAAEAARVPKPTLLKLAALFLGFWGVVALPLGLSLLVSEGGTYTLNGVAVTREEFMARAGAAFALFPVLGVVTIAIAVGIATGRRWARPLLLGFFALGPVVPVLALAPGNPDVRSDLPWSLGVALAFGGLVWWYLYRRPNVVAYYRSLASGRRRRESPAAAGRPAA